MRVGGNKIERGGGGVGKFSKINNRGRLFGTLEYTFYWSREFLHNIVFQEWDFIALLGVLSNFNKVRSNLEVIKQVKMINKRIIDQQALNMLSTPKCLSEF